MTTVLENPNRFESVSCKKHEVIYVIYKLMYTRRNDEYNHIAGHEVYNEWNKSFPNRKISKPTIYAVLREYYDESFWDSHLLESAFNLVFYKLSENKAVKRTQKEITALLNNPYRLWNIWSRMRPGDQIGDLKINGMIIGRIAGVNEKHFFR